MRPLSLISCCLTAALLGTGMPGGAEGQTLRYEGEEGQTDRYRLRNTVKIHQELQGISTELTVLSNGLLSLELEDLEDDTLTFGVTFDSLELKFEGAPVPAPDLTPVLGRKMTLKLSPTGKVHTFELPADMPATPPGFDLKQMVGHFFPRLPQKKARAGLIWADTLVFPVAQQGIESQVQVVTTYTAKGETKAPEGTFIEVDFATAVSVHGKGEQAGAPLFLDGKGTGNGEIRFSEDGETFWSSKGTQSLDLVVDVTPAGQPPMSIPIREEITTEIQHL